MKKILLSTAIVFSFSMVKAQTLILAKDVAKYAGKSVIICDSVYSTKAFEKLNLLNLGGNYPNEPVTLVINKEDIAKFASEPASMYMGNNICVTGIVSEFKGKYQIVVTEPKQIVVK